MSKINPTSENSLPPFDLKTDKYDQNTLSGRFKHFFEIFNPKKLLTTKKQLEEAIALLDDFKEEKISNSDPKTTARLWEAKAIRDAILHPQTNEIIPLPFRFSFYTLMNIPIVAGMIASRGAAAQIFWQWFNQSYNVAVNFSNGNKTNPQPPDQIAKAYCAAVTVSCGLSIILGRFAGRIGGKSRPLAAVARGFIPFFSVATAGVSNVLLMRYNEAIDGIEVRDEEGTNLGVSKAAGVKALQQVSLTRAFLPVPILLFPAILKTVILDRSNFLKRFPRLMLPANVALIAIILYYSLPLAIGLFPQTGSIKVNQIEERFKNLKTKNGNPVLTVFFNKGL